MFAKVILHTGGVVFGAIFDENLKVVHKSIEDENELYKLRKSTTL